MCLCVVGVERFVGEGEELKRVSATMASNSDSLYLSGMEPRVKVCSRTILWVVTKTHDGWMCARVSCVRTHCNLPRLRGHVDIFFRALHDETVWHTAYLLLCDCAAMGLLLLVLVLVVVVVV